MGEVNIVVGLSGVGKGTVLEEAMLLADREYEVINYGDRMLETAKEEGLVDSRDELKELDSETNRRIQKEAADSIQEEAEEKDIIVDTHAAIKTPFGYLPGLPKWTVENLEPSKIIMLRADPEAIWSRTQGDESRDREHESPADIREYQDVGHEMASTCAVLSGAFFKVIDNEESKAEKAAEELVETLRG
ncbi:MAG: adenylate kinase [Candidatus Nanohaloarchaea archaeon]